MVLDGAWTGSLAEGRGRWFLKRPLTLEPAMRCPGVASSTGSGQKDSQRRHRSQKLLRWEFLGAASVSHRIGAATKLLSLQRRLPSPCRIYRIQDFLLLWGVQTRQTATRVVASPCLSVTIHPDNGVAGCIPWYAPPLARQVPTAVHRPGREADMEACRNFTERGYCLPRDARQPCP